MQPIYIFLYELYDQLGELTRLPYGPIILWPQSLLIALILIRSGGGVKQLLFLSSVPSILVVVLSALSAFGLKNFIDWGSQPAYSIAQMVHMVLMFVFLTWTIVAAFSPSDASSRWKTVALYFLFFGILASDFTFNVLGGANGSRWSGTLQSNPAFIVAATAGYFVAQFLLTIILPAISGWQRVSLQRHRAWSYPAIVIGVVCVLAVGQRFELYRSALVQTTRVLLGN